MHYLCIEDKITEASYRKDYRFSESDNIIFARNLTEALNIIENQYNKFDTVIIDIDLSLGQPIEDKSYEDFLKDIIPIDKLKITNVTRLTKEQMERLKVTNACQLTKEQLEDENDKVISKLIKNAGFYIYMKLLHLGFPKDRIIFLSANTSGIKNNITKMQNVKELLIEETDVVYKKVASNSVNDAEIKNYIHVLKKHDGGFAMDLTRVANRLKKFYRSKNTDRLINCLEELKKGLLEINLNRNGNETYDEFEENFLNVGIIPPESYSKDEIDLFEEWKKEKDTAYYRLRTAIRETCEEIEGLIKNFKNNTTDENLEGDLNNFLIFRKYLKSEHSKDVYTLQYFEDMITSLKNILPLREPNEWDKKSLYRQIIITISHPWEAGKESLPRKNRGNSSGPVPRTDLFKHSVTCIMKMLRNWVSHTKIKDVDESDVSYLFLISLRSFFYMEFNKVYDYEKVLLRITGEKMPEPILLDESDSSRRIELFNYVEKSLEDLSVHINKVIRPTIAKDMPINVYEVLCRLGDKDRKDYNNSVSSFIEIFKNYKDIEIIQSAFKLPESDYIIYFYKLYWYIMFYPFICQNKGTLKYELRCNRINNLINEQNRDDIVSQIYIHTFDKVFS